jgi:hypothetical protein
LAIGLSDAQVGYFIAQSKLRSYRKVIHLSSSPQDGLPTVPPISGQAALATCLTRTALGLDWEPGEGGGANPYLCEEDATIFSEIVKRAAAQLNCIGTNQGLSIAFRIREDRRAMAMRLLRSIGSDGLAEDVKLMRAEVPDWSWIKGAVERLGIKIKRAQKLEELRRISCNTVAIRSFLDKFELLMNRDPLLILNCDETNISSRKRFRVLVPEGWAALKNHAGQLPHFSAMCTISAAGDRFRPMIILPNCMHNPSDLKDFERAAYFVSTDTGWMKRTSFLIYVHFLYCELVRYRADLPLDLQRQTMLLIIDGHTSRWSFEAMIALRALGLDVLVLFPHCTHLLQPFDVSVASPVKAALIYFLTELRFDADDLARLLNPMQKETWLAEKRRNIIDAFLNAWDRGASRRNIQAGSASHR